MDKMGLGKGLSAILGEMNPTNTPGADAVELIPIGKLKPGRYQPRKVFASEPLVDLVASIAAKGVLQPLLIRPLPEQPGMYEIIAGERRWRAATQAGLTTVPAIVKNFSDKETLEVSLIENLQRQDLNALEEAAAYVRLLKEFQYTQEELSRVVGKSRSHVANMMRLLDLPEEVKKMLETNVLSAGHARALLNTAHPETLAKRIISQGLNVRQAEQLAMQDSEKKARATKNKPEKGRKDHDILALEAELSALLKTAVSIKWTGKGGKIVLTCNSLEKLDTILQRLTNGGPVDD